VTDTGTSGQGPAWKPPAGIGLGGLLREAELAFSKVFRRELARHSVTVAQYQHLRLLWENDGITQAEIARHLGIETPSSTATLDSLEREGLVRRVRNRSDRRKVNVFLTERSLALRPALVECARRTNRVALEGIAESDVRRFFELARMLTGNLREHAETESAMPRE